MVPYIWRCLTGGFYTFLIKPERKTAETWKIAALRCRLFSSQHPSLFCSTRKLRYLLQLYRLSCCCWWWCCCCMDLVWKVYLNFPRPVTSTFFFSFFFSLFYSPLLDCCRRAGCLVYFGQSFPFSRLTEQIFSRITISYLVMVICTSVLPDKMTSTLYNSTGTTTKKSNKKIDTNATKMDSVALCRIFF